MPELPEVETIKNILNTFIQNRKIISIDVLRESTILGDTNDFKSKLKGETFLNVSRIGKYLIFHLTNELVIISHLRMEGKYYQFNENEKNSKHARVVFHLDNNKKLVYDDSRCFGIMKLSKEDSYLNEKEIKILGKEPFDIKDGNYLLERAKRTTLPIKSFLLDQSVMTGLGNIYVDEVLYKSKIHPLTPANMISKKEFDVILINSVETLNEAIKSGGSTIKSYHPTNSVDGKFQTKLVAYGKYKTQCPNCGTYFRFIKVNGRGTTFCPSCQFVRKKQIIIGLTGKIASGKSTVLSIFKSKGIPAISSDEIVKNLYKKKCIVDLVNKEFNLTFENEIDKSILRQYLISNPSKISKLNKIIHPLVKREIISFIKANKSELIVAEVPLLFEAKFEQIFDYIIALDISKTNQEKRLKERNPNSYIDLENINKNNKFEEYKKMVDIIIKNDKDINHLENQINKIINKLKDRLN